MFIVAAKISPTESAVFLVLQDDDLDRMKMRDPIRIEFAKMITRWCGGLELRDLCICYVTPEEEKRVKTLCDAGKPAEVVQLLNPHQVIESD